VTISLIGPPPRLKPHRSRRRELALGEYAAQEEVLCEKEGPPFAERKNGGSAHSSAKAERRFQVEEEGVVGASGRGR